MRTGSSAAPETVVLGPDPSTQSLWVLGSEPEDDEELGVEGE
jgi:hypothetical protein